MNIAAYCRVSTDKEDQLNSLDAQKRFFTEFTEKNGHTLVRLYADEGISGTKFCGSSPSVPEEKLHRAILKAPQAQGIRN